MDTRGRNKFPHKGGFSLRDRERSSVIHEGLRVELLLLCVQRNQLRSFSISQGASRTPPQEGVSDTSSWEEAMGLTEDFVEGLYLDTIL